jgi:hypothetical protein
MWFLIILCGAVLAPASARAQSLPANDLVFSVGWSGAEYSAAGSNESWQGSLLLGLSAGHYWTPHVKTEIEAGWNSPTTGEIYQEIIIGTTRAYGYADHRAADLRFSLGQSYQFGRNQWVHPYIGAGIDMVRRDTRLSRTPQSRPFYVVPPRPAGLLIPAIEEHKTETLARAFIKGGCKMYATDRLFFTTELKVGFASELDHAAVKLGIGFDF